MPVGASDVIVCVFKLTGVDKADCDAMAWDVVDAAMNDSDCKGR